MSDTHEVRYNYCDCHPETCCCNPWALFYKVTGKKIATFYNKSDADSLREELNALNGGVSNAR